MPPILVALYPSAKSYKSRIIRKDCDVTFLCKPPLLYMRGSHHWMPLLSSAHMKVTLGHRIPTFSSFFPTHTQCNTQPRRCLSAINDAKPKTFSVSIFHKVIMINLIWKVGGSQNMESWEIGYGHQRGSWLQKLVAVCHVVISFPLASTPCFCVNTLNDMDSFVWWR